MRQFYNSVSKDDYFALRNGFIAVSETSSMGFHAWYILPKTITSLSNLLYLIVLNSA